MNVVENDEFGAGMAARNRLLMKNTKVAIRRKKSLLLTVVGAAVAIIIGMKEAAIAGADCWELPGGRQLLEKRRLCCFDRLMWLVLEKGELLDGNIYNILLKMYWLLVVLDYFILYYVLDTAGFCLFWQVGIAAVTNKSYQFFCRILRKMLFSILRRRCYVFAADLGCWSFMFDYCPVWKACSFLLCFEGSFSYFWCILLLIVFNKGAYGILFFGGFNEVP